MSRALRATILVAGAVATAAAATPASAYYGTGAEMIADYVRLEQGDDSTVFAAISGDGRYVAVQTRARNFFADDDPDPPGQFRAGAIFRYEIATKTLEKVADGDLFDEDANEFLRRGASNPSISADGRFIVFATAEPIIAADTNDNVDVYVRDMDVSIDQAGAFDLVSARDGGDVPATYGPPDFPFPGSNPGVDISRGVAISADGQRVAFRTAAPSDLPAAGTPTVPAGQLLVRDRTLNTTTLVTRTDPGGDPAGGAVGASISADGTTVAWTGASAPAQTRFLGGENQDPTLHYYLWRKVADGPGAPTRRITGIADPDDPGCPPGSFTFFDSFSTGPCYGFLTDQEATRTSIESQVPALSADGNTVAFLTGAGPRPLTNTGSGLDLFVTRMTAGLSRKQATTELTRDSATFDPTISSPVSSIALAADGRYLALTTQRTDFSLGALTPTGPSRTVANTREVFVVDLQANTLDRVARSAAGGDINGDVQNGVTIANGGERVAFTSFAGNLFFGDANERPDAFIATRAPDPGTGGGGGGGGGGGDAIIVPDEDPRVSARAKSGAKGVVRLTVSVPAAGGVKAEATARAGQPPKKRTLATATGRAAGPGTVELVLRPVSRYKGELRERGKIRGRAHIGFVASAGGRKLNASIGITFRQRAAEGGG